MDIEHIPLTDRQEEMLDFIVLYNVDNGYLPSFREIGRQMSITSTNGVRCHLEALERKGWLTFTRNRARAISLTDKARTEYNLRSLGKSAVEALGSLEMLVEDFPNNVDLGACRKPYDGAQAVIQKVRNILARINWED